MEIGEGESRSVTDCVISCAGNRGDVGSWIMLIRGKKDLAVNHKKERAKEIVLKLVREVEGVVKVG